MSTAVLEKVSEIQDQVIELIDGVKEPVSKAIDTVVAFVVDRVEVPALPFAEHVPTPREIIDNQSRFASKLVTTNKTVALSAAKAAAPLTDQLLDRKVAPAKRSTAKASATAAA